VQFKAQLQGALLYETSLDGADLDGAELYGLQEIKSETRKLTSQLIIADNVKWTTMNEEARYDLTDDLQRVMHGNLDWLTLERLKGATMRDAPKLDFQSCLAPIDTPLMCNKRFDPEKPNELRDFNWRLFVYLGQLACESPEIARGLLKQIPKWERLSLSYSREGLEIELKKLLSDRKCKGLQNLNDEEKNKLRAMQ
jgi:hypothetical protein